MRVHAKSSLVVLLLALAAGCSSETGPADVATIGEPAPAYAAPTLEGDSLDLASLRGEVVLLNVWATWCPPCRDEMPDLERLHTELAPRGFRVLAVSVDESGATEQVEAFRDEYELTLTVLHDRSQTVMRRFQPRGIPESFLIGRDGRVLRRWIGRIEPGAPSVRSAIEEALAAS